MDNKSKNDLINILAYKIRDYNKNQSIKYKLILEYNGNDELEEKNHKLIVIFKIILNKEIEVYENYNLENKIKIKRRLNYELIFVRKIILKENNEFTSYGISGVFDDDCDKISSILVCINKWEKFMRNNNKIVLKIYNNESDYEIFNLFMYFNNKGELVESYPIYGNYKIKELVTINNY